MRRKFTKSSWDAYATCYDALNELRPYAQMLEDVAEKLVLTGNPLLDAGCGTGNLIAKLSPERAGKIVGIDASMAMLAHANVKCPHAEFWLADLDSMLPFEDASFGTLVCMNALYAVTHPANVLAEFDRVLRPGGSLIIATPKFGYENGLILKAHCCSPEDDAHWMNAHETPAREETLLREAVRDDVLIERFLQIARSNRAIATERSFHFFTEEDLSRLVQGNGFKNVQVAKTYADQNLLLTAKRRHERNVS